MGNKLRRAGGAVAVLAIVGAAVALALSASGGGDVTGGATGAGLTTPSAETTIAGSPNRVPMKHHRKSTTIALPKSGSAALYVKNGADVRIVTAPSGGTLVRHVGPHTPFGSRTTFSVVKTQGDWAGVTTPYLENDQLGWVKLDSRRLAAYASYWTIDIDLSSRSASVLRSGKVVRSFPVTVGAPGTDTPIGRFAITDTFRGGLNPAYGCCAVALTAHQPNIPSGWLGGSRIAIHGTYGELGAALSHGCVRAADADVNDIVSHVPIGTPVVIHE